MQPPLHPTWAPHSKYSHVFLSQGMKLIQLHGNTIDLPCTSSNMNAICFNKRQASREPAASWLSIHCLRSAFFCVSLMVHQSHPIRSPTNELVFSEIILPVFAISRSPSEEIRRCQSLPRFILIGDGSQTLPILHFTEQEKLCKISFPLCFPSAV